MIIDLDIVNKNYYLIYIDGVTMPKLISETNRVEAIKQVLAYSLGWTNVNKSVFATIDNDDSSEVMMVGDLQITIKKIA